MFRPKLRQKLIDIFGITEIREKPVEFGDEKDCLYLNIANIEQHYAPHYAAFIARGSIGYNSENASYGFFSRQHYNYDKINGEKELTLIGSETALHFGGGNDKDFTKYSQDFIYHTQIDFDNPPKDVTIIPVEFNVKGDN
jgi:hypothetical protein